MTWNMDLQSLLLAALFLSAALSLSAAAPISNHSISPNFTASHYQFIDHAGVFLRSPAGDFSAAISNPAAEPSSRFYLSVFHAASHSLIWTANRNAPVSDSGVLTLTAAGLTLTAGGLSDGTIVWSTPVFASPVSSLRLEDSGNLVLLDGNNVSLWASFDHPTDTIVAGQRLPVGSTLVGSVSDTDLSAGEYRFSVTGSDAVLTWNEVPYWKLSMDTKAFRDSNAAVSYLAVNTTGVYLYGGSGVVVFQLVLDSSSVFRMAQLTSGGRFVVSGGDGAAVKEQFGAPADSCRIPMICGGIGLCSGTSCSCPPGFKAASDSDGSCSPATGPYSLPPANYCNSSHSSPDPSISYLKLSDGSDYYAIDFTNPTRDGVNRSACQDLCSRNCSCLAIFYKSSSGSCYLIQNKLGSIISSSATDVDLSGYIKALMRSSTTESSPASSSSKFPIAGLVLLPSFGFILLVVFIVLALRRRRNRVSRTAEGKLHREDSYSSGELEIISIPGLPVRFEYKQLVAATENFKTHIGSGGFGTVYRGTLPDKTTVAVKKITNLGVQGKKEFCTEIAVIGNIHHVNLVRLRGFCAIGRQRFLVYEYMNRGSLAGALFCKAPILIWPERLEIALGTARALAYLHNGCEHKIIHCDVKPENILLHDRLQVKISDFGLSKLLSPEQSSLFTTMRGTRGYLAPEWLTSSAITDKTDVYSFGMVLLEIIRGRKNCAMQSQSPTQSDEESDSSPMNRRPMLSSSLSSGPFRTPPPVYFPLMALEMHEQGRYEQLVDPRLEIRPGREQAEKLVRIALCCVHEDPVLRPTMVNVVGMLEGGFPVPEPRMESLNFLRFYGRRFSEASTVGTDPLQNSGSDSRPVLSGQEHGQGNGLVVRGARNYYVNSSSGSGSSSFMSYMSSQQVSGPR